MRLEGAHLIDAPRDRVWDVLNDAGVLQRHMPGCESLRPTGDDQYEAVLKMGVAAIKGTYTANISITDKDQPNGYTLHVEGKGKPGYVKGEGRVTLSDKDGGTELRYDGELHIGGIIARVGQRMIGGLAERMTRQFFEELGNEARA